MLKNITTPGGSKEKCEETGTSQWPPRTALGSLAAPGSLRSCIRKPYRVWRPPNSVLKNMITPHDCNKTHEESKLKPKVCSDSLGSLICRRHSLQYVCTRGRERARSLQGRVLQRDAPAADWQARIRVRIKDEVAVIECQITQHLDRGCGCAPAPPIAKRLHALQLLTENQEDIPVQDVSFVRPFLSCHECQKPTGLNRHTTRSRPREPKMASSTCKILG